MLSKRRKKNTETVIDLDRPSQRLTRGRERQIRATFPILQLPGELREKIYTVYFSFDFVMTEVNTFVWGYEGSEFDEYNLDEPEERDYLAFVHNIRTPTLLLLNKQIFGEAQAVMRRTSALHITEVVQPRYIGLKFFVSPGMLQNLSSIKLDDKGLEVMIHLYADGKREDRLLYWLRYASLLTELSDELQRYHNLKSFTFEISHKEVLKILEDPEEPWEWFPGKFQKHMDAIKRLRGISEVRFIGCPDDIADECTELMQRKK